MSFPKLTFPLSIDCYGTGYWIGETGPFKYGEAVTAFFIGDIKTDNAALMQELEIYLRSFGSYLHAYTKSTKVPEEWFHQLEQSSVECSVNYYFHPEPGKLTLVERYTFSSLRDFLYMELGKATLKGNGPRQCRLCGNWFFHEQGDRAIYCERVAPGEEVKTCREVGARVTFESKLQSEEPWKIYKRAYKKYYARVMKGNMSREDFEVWAERAAEERNRIIPIFSQEEKPERRAEVIETFREKLNRD